MEKNLRIMALLAIISVVFFFASSGVSERSLSSNVAPRAQIGGGLDATKGITHTGTPFGGLIVGEIICTCHPPDKLIYVQEYTTNSVKNILVAPPFSRLWQHWTMNTGQYVLGTYTTGPRCYIRVSQDCIPLPTDGAINSGPGAGSSGFYDFGSLWSF